MRLESNWHRFDNLVKFDSERYLAVCGLYGLRPCFWLLVGWELCQRARLTFVFWFNVYRGRHGKTAPGKTLLSENDKSVIPPVNTQKEIAKAAGVSTGQVGNTNASDEETTLSENDKLVLPPVNTRKEIAKAAGVSTGQVNPKP